MEDLTGQKEVLAKIGHKNGMPHREVQALALPDRVMGNAEMFSQYNAFFCYIFSFSRHPACRLPVDKCRIIVRNPFYKEAWRLERIISLPGIMPES